MPLLKLPCFTNPEFRREISAISDFKFASSPTSEFKLVITANFYFKKSTNSKFKPEITANSESELVLVLSFKFKIRIPSFNSKLM